MATLGVGPGVWRLLGYFTILTNLAVAVVATCVLVAPASRLAGARGRLAVAAAILLVGVVYGIALSGLQHLAGLALLLEIVFHKATPVLFALAWLAGPHPGLGWRALGRATILPLGYLVYALARGAWDHWYAYWFLDPARMAPAQLALSVAVLTAATLAIGAGLVWLDRTLARRAGR